MATFRLEHSQHRLDPWRQPSGSSDVYTDRYRTGAPRYARGQTFGHGSVVGGPDGQSLAIRFACTGCRVWTVVRRRVRLFPRGLGVRRDGIEQR